jgi:hypothetical protein
MCVARLQRLQSGQPMSRYIWERLALGYDRATESELRKLSDPELGAWVVWALREALAGQYTHARGLEHALALRVRP